MADAGGLHALFSMALGGLVGTTPHMIAASVMALARLLFEFAGGRPNEAAGFSHNATFTAPQNIDM